MQFRKSLISLALASTFVASNGLSAAVEPNAEASIEKIAVTGQRIAYANNTTDEAMLDTVSPAGNVLDAIKYLPGVSVGQGDAFGSDDWSTTISMRGFQRQPERTAAWHYH
ncbi:MAG: TonB-dependent receptor plug domain-containing protein [Rheinheimera sp.]|nr:TonB-dependent receptor plug domain-containing protein [Rheinheimera sp.]